jgi:hypothetical protein
MRRTPRTALRPPVSMIAFHSSGLSGVLLGAVASTRLVMLNRIRSSSRQSSCASSTSRAAVCAEAMCACMTRRSTGLPVHAGSAKRLSAGSGAATG